MALPRQLARRHDCRVELLFILVAVVLLDIAALFFGADSRGHTLSGGAAHSIG